MMADTKLIAVLLLPLLFCTGCTESGKERDLQSTLESLWNKYKAHSLIFKPDENPVAQEKETSTDKIQTEEIIGPFGLKQGISVEDLTKKYGFTETNKGPDEYGGMPPKPLYQLVQYVYIATKNYGLCAIVGATDGVEINVFADQITGPFFDVGRLLEMKYGKPGRDIHQVKPGSALNRPQDLAMAISRGEATYTMTWLDGENGMVLPNELKKVELNVMGFSPTQALLTLTYKFKNYDGCLSEIRAEAIKSL